MAIAGGCYAAMLEKWLPERPRDVIYTRSLIIWADQ